MKVYGYTLIDTEGMGDGTHSESEIFISKERRDNSAIDKFIHHQYYYREAGILTSEYDKRPKEELLKDIDRAGGYLRLAYGENFTQFEIWEKDL